MSYKWCVVLQCKNTSIRNPEKVFVSVPTNAKRRIKWLKLARRDPQTIASHTNVFMCEDHFDMEKDTINYMQYTMGFSKKILLTDEAMPKKFHCQEDRKSRLCDPEYCRDLYAKRRRMDLLKECEKEICLSSENSTVSTFAKDINMPQDIINPDEVFEMSEDITQKNAQNCKNYRSRKKNSKQLKNKYDNLKNKTFTKRTNSDHCKMYRLRKKIIALELQSEKEDEHTTTTSSLKMTFEPQPITTDVKDTIKMEMEDVKEHTDIQTNERIVKTNTIISNDVSNQKTIELDKFKRRMIRAIARLLYIENKAEADIWDDLKAETGCDCEILWSRMRALTIKKLDRLFTAEDKIHNISKIVQLSVTDWLLYDLVLVHEKVDVIGQDLHNKEEPSFLRDLFNVVEEFNIENAAGEELCEKWFEATAKYNNTGKRQCSPMLLQKRWYQLKERSRSNFYNFWFQYRGDSRKLERANKFKPSDLQLDIVKRYKDIVTKPFLNWEVLVKERRVALPADFERLRLTRNKITLSENEPDLELIEQKVETIDLEEINDSNDSVNKNTDNNYESNDFNIDIVKVESLAEQDDDVSVLESVHIPLEKCDSSEVNNSDVEVETKSSDDDLEIIESDSEQIMPKIASVISTAYLESAKDNDTPEKIPPQEINKIKDCGLRAYSVEAANSILEQILKNAVENKIIIDIDEKNAKTSKEKNLSLDKDVKELKANLTIDLDKKEIKKINVNKQDNKNSCNTRENYELNNDVEFDDFSNNFNFIDDGIAFVDDGIEYVDEDYTQIHKTKQEIKSEIIEAKNEEEPKIDLKLLLTPVVYTKRLDDMDVFRFIDYNSVKDDRVLHNASRESKPEDSKSINMKKIIQECNHDDLGNVESDSDDITPDYDIAMSSWLFRKPKVNIYNPIQLCKNPDFNTRLKRLAAAFYTSQRNRLLLKQCKPLTVDLHKTFESKLINNTLYLKKTKNDLDIDIHFDKMFATSCKTELPEVMEANTDTEMAVDKQISIEQTSEIHMERNKVINLPDIEQIRRVNQGLLVAEVSPIQVLNPVTQTNVKSQNNFSNTIDETETPDMYSTAADEEIIKNPSNASQFALEMDKVKAPESDDSKIIDIVTVDNEQSETLVSNKSFNFDSLLRQTVPKHRTKTDQKIHQKTKKYMELSWLPKPQASRIDTMDCLLAADTVERILSLCKDDYISQDPKVHKTKRRKRRKEERRKLKEENIIEKPVPAVKQKPIQEKKNEKETKISKNKKCRISITSQTTNIKNVCCWSRRKIENFYKLNTGKHFCLHNKCVCCCKADLEAKILDMEQQRQGCEPIILSDDESTTMTSAKKHLISKVTIGTNTDYDKEFEDQFAANLNILKDNANQVYTPIISLPLSDLPQTFTNESGCQTQTSNLVEKFLPPTTIDDKTASTQKSKPKLPISLGRNKILLCSFKPTTMKTSVKRITKINHNTQSVQVLPEGCHLVLLPNRELALSIDPGVELDTDQLNKLPSIIAAVQKQIKIIPTSENNLDPNKVTSNEETVIHLSDDEKSKTNDDDKNNLNFNDSSKSKSSPTVNLDSSIADTVTDVGAITNEEKLTPSSNLNNLSSPKEPCNILEYKTTNNSTIQNVGDNIDGEVIDNSTNNAEDESGVNKKTILSDLMEMSGISTDDIIVSNNDGNAAGIDGSVSNNVSAVTNGESISIIHPVLSQSDSSTSDLQRVYGNITRSVGINPIVNNFVIQAALLRCPELNVVSSFPELKYAYENGAQFFKMDVVSGIIVPINICIQKDMKEISRKKISKVPKSVIDLTEDSEIPTVSHQPHESFDEKSQCIQPDINSSPIKPIKMFEAIHPSILRNSGRSLLVRPIKNSMMMKKKTIGVMKHNRKQGLNVRNYDETDLIKVKKLEIQNNPSNIIESDAESDEEYPVKPIKMFKAIHPSILRYSGRSLLVRPIKNSMMMKKKTIGFMKHNRKQGLNVRNYDETDLIEGKKLEIQNNPSNIIESDAESDEEPLAKKAKRIKHNVERENQNNDSLLELDSDKNSKESATMDINHQLSPLEQIVFEDNTGQSSDDDCILGV